MEPKKICPVMSAGPTVIVCTRKECEWWVTGYSYERDSEGHTKTYPRPMCAIALLAQGRELPL